MEQLNRLALLIQSADKIILSTHRQCDGDGLGAELAVYFGLKKIGKQARIINVDGTPKKYRFLEPDRHIQYFESDPQIPFEPDLTLVFDTNDSRMLGDLYPVLEKASRHLAFVDHHPILTQGPFPTSASYIDTSAASTGEMAYQILKQLNIPLDLEIARSLYTSLAFDTQLFRFIRNSPKTHLIAAELLVFPIGADIIHRSLFGNQTVNKMAFLAKALGQIEYFSEGRLALLKLKDSDLFHYNLEPDDSRDVIDMVMNIETLEAAALFREDAPNEYKLSLRSKGRIEVLDVAESLNGGGHPFAAGAFVRGKFSDLKKRVVDQLIAKLESLQKTGS